LHHARVHAPEYSTRFCAQNIHVCNRQVVACDGDIEIIFQCQMDGVLQRQIELAVFYQLIQSRRIFELRF